MSSAEIYKNSENGNTSKQKQIEEIVQEFEDVDVGKLETCDNAEMKIRYRVIKKGKLR